MSESCLSNSHLCDNKYCSLGISFALLELVLSCMNLVYSKDIGFKEGFFDSTWMWWNKKVMIMILVLMRHLKNLTWSWISILPAWIIWKSITFWNNHTLTWNVIYRVIDINFPLLVFHKDMFKLFVHHC